MESFKSHKITWFALNLLGGSIALALKNAFQNCKPNNWDKIGTKQYLWNAIKRDKKWLAVHYYKKFRITRIVILKITKLSIFQVCLVLQHKKPIGLKKNDLQHYKLSIFLIDCNYCSALHSIGCFTLHTAIKATVDRHNYFEYKQWLNWYL